MDENKTPQNEETDIKIVSGYRFSKRADAARARKEFENVAKIRNRVHMDNTDDLLKLYSSLVSKRFFVTPIGLSFLQELRQELVARKGSDAVPPVPVPRLTDKKTPPEDTPQYVMLREKYEKTDETRSRLKALNTKLMIVIAALVTIIIGMFVIVIANQNMGYINTENKVLDKYSAWEEELNQRERELNEREEQLLK